jgi:CubicO group peptidase (beta-lactamase class C family)
MIGKLDLLLDVYRPCLRGMFLVGDLVRRIPGFERLFLHFRGAASRPPPAVDAARSKITETGAGAPVNMDAMLEKIVGPHGCPGLAAVALRGDRIIAQGVAGYRKRGAFERITLGDQFHLGSCGKAMTATLAAMLIEEGKLGWTTTLAELFEDKVKGIHPAWRSVTLQQVLAHRSGLPRDTGMTLRIRMVSSTLSLHDQRLEIVRAVLSRPPRYRPGAKLVYSNTGYMFVGAALEKITRRDWPDLMQERLFRPLGITSGGFGPPGTAGQVDQPWGHCPVLGSPIDPGDRLADGPMFDIPAGLQHMAITDWAKFIAIHLRGDAANPHRQSTLLRPETFAKLHPFGAGQGYASGWIPQTEEWARGAQPGASGRVLFHGGSNFRWFCVVWLAPEIDFAVMSACNRGMDLAAWTACHQAARALIRAFVPGWPTPL